MGTEMERFVPAEWSRKGEEAEGEREKEADVMNKGPSSSSLTADWSSERNQQSADLRPRFVPMPFITVGVNNIKDDCNYLKMPRKTCKLTLVNTFYFQYSWRFMLNDRFSML